MASNNYFQSLPKETQDALGKAAFDAFIYTEPHFQFSGQWQAMKTEMHLRWLAVVEAVMNKLMGLDETVTGKMEAFNKVHGVLSDAIERFESIRIDDTMFNNYQALDWLKSAHAEIVNARLLMLRADIAAGNIGHGGDESTLPVNIPNVRPPE